MADLITISEHRSSSGAGLLNESRKAFQALESYKGLIKTTAVVSYPDRVWQESRTYDVSYSAPDSLVCRGTDSNNNPLTIVSHGTKVQMVSAAAHTGVLPAASSAKKALWTYSGVTVRATIMLPSALLGIQCHFPHFVAEMSLIFQSADLSPRVHHLRRQAASFRNSGMPTVESGAATRRPTTA